MSDTAPIEIAQSKSEKQTSFRALIEGKGIIVEFVGPTGCGKSTNCNYLSLLLKRKGFNVVVFNDIKGHFWRLSLFNKAQVVASALYKYRAILFQYVLLLMKHRMLNADSLSRYIRLCTFNTVLQQVKEKEKPDVILLDQWIIQGLWSAIILNANKHQPEPAELKRYLFSVDITIYFDVDTTTANERIKTRSFGDSRFDQMEEGKRLIALRKYTHYLFGLYQQSEYKTKWMFSAYESPEQNASKFLLLLKNELSNNQLWV